MFRFKKILILFVFIIFTTLISQPSHFYFENVNVGDVSDTNIFSPKDYRYIDEEATNKLKSEAVEKIQIVYIENDEIYESISKDFNEFISSVILAKENKVTADKKTKTQEESIEKKIKKINNPFKFSDEELEKFLNIENTELNKINEIFLTELKRIFDVRVTEENLEAVVSQFKGNTNFYYFFSQDITKALVNKLSKRIQPNFIIDTMETEKRKEESLKSIDDIYKVIKKGELIVRVGDVVSEEQYKKLESLGLIKTDLNYFDVFKQLPYYLLVFALFYIYCFHFYKKEFSTMKPYLFILLSMSLVVGVTGFIKDTMFSTIPLLTMLMVYMVFWGRKFVIFSSIILGLLISMGDFVSFSLSVIAGIILTLFYSDNSKRINIIFTGVMVGCVLSISDSIVYYSFEQSFNFRSHFSFLFSAFGASILTVGLIPLFENMLGLVTSVRLYELSDPHHPLLKRLLSEALGTYTHSLMVANLAEMAAENINANGLLLRVGAYFHDVGKLKNPEYFIENSTPSTNPHLDLEPKVSAHIIREHPIDSVKMCREYNIPEPIIELIYSHHGDATLSHLYKPAKEKNPETSIEDFKYQTPTPKTKEQGILLLADSTEAYSRVVKDEPKEEVKGKIKNMIFSKVEDGTLRDCELTLQDLNIIIDTFTNYLINSNHERISYDKEETK